jgi:hypothetical protein
MTEDRMNKSLLGALAVAHGTVAGAQSGSVTAFPSDEVTALAVD